ncbi:MAG TPA: GlsB/YeaQ/YmgE family stress response membrane protein [Rubrobacter sp.]|nr:GlsB/YeaQ/YmgE family stress response membrane protein [Rubrobacter sp.]
MALVVVGLIAGVLAKWVMPGPDPGGIIITILIGIAGAFVGGFIVQRVFGGPPMTSIGIGSILVATLGAVLLLAVYRLITRRAV